MRVNTCRTKDRHTDGLIHSSCIVRVECNKYVSSCPQIYSLSKYLRNWSAVFFFSSTVCCKEGPSVFVENLEFTITDIYV